MRIQVIKKCQCRALTTLIHLGCHAYTTTNAFGFSLVAYARNDQVERGDGTAGCVTKTIARPSDVLPQVGENPPSGWRRTPPVGENLRAGLRIKFSPNGGGDHEVVRGVKVLSQSFGKNARTRIPPSSADADTSPRGQNL